MSLTLRLSIGVTFGLLLSLSTPFIIPAISHSSSFSTAQAQMQADSPQFPSFGDVPTTYWAYDYIEGLAKLNIITGFGNGSFRPDEPVTRAQFAAIIRQAFITNPASAQQFADVPANYWAAQPISAARSSGFLSGYPGNLFKPGQNIPRTQAFVSLANGLKYASNNPQRLTAYTDSNEIPAYARSAVAAADEAGIVVHYPFSDKLEPNRNATRADVAAFVYQALVKQGRATAVAAPLEWRTVPAVTIPTVAEQMSFSKSGQQLVTLARYGESFQIWNAQTGALSKEVTATTGTGFRAVAISEDGTKVTAILQDLSTNVVELAAWTVATGEQLWRKPLGNPQTRLLAGDIDTAPYYQNAFFQADGKVPYFQFAFSPNGEQIVTQSNFYNSSQGVSDTSGQIRLYDAATGDVLQSLKAHSGDDAGNSAQLKQFAVSTDGKFLASANYFSSVRTPEPNKVDIWQLNENNRYDYFKTISISGYLVSLLGVTFTNSGFLNVLSLQENYLTVPCSESYAIHIDALNVQTGEQVGRVEPPYEGCVDGSIRLTASDQYYSVENEVEKLVGILQAGKRQNFEGNNVAINSSGNYLAVAGDQNVSLFTKTTHSNP